MTGAELLWTCRRQRALVRSHEEKIAQLEAEKTSIRSPGFDEAVQTSHKADISDILIQIENNIIAEQKAYKKLKQLEKVAAEARRKQSLGIQKCIICGKEGVESALLVCRECLQKLLYQWARTCEPGHRKCLVCGKDFVPNAVEVDAEYYIHVAGRLTCSIQCTDELYAGVLDKKKIRAHTRDGFRDNHELKD